MSSNVYWLYMCFYINMCIVLCMCKLPTPGHFDPYQVKQISPTGDLKLNSW